MIYHLTNKFDLNNRKNNKLNCIQSEISHTDLSYHFLKKKQIDDCLVNMNEMSVCPR